MTLVETAAHWAAYTFRRRTEEIAAGRGRIDDAYPGSRVSWSEVRERFKLALTDRPEFTEKVNGWLKKWGMMGVLSSKVSATEWVKRRTERARKQEMTAIVRGVRKRP